MNKSHLLIAAIFMLVSIIMGALGAHAFKDLLSADEMNSFKTATLFLTTQSIGIFIFQIIGNTFNIKAKLASMLLIWGAMLFCFSIYFLLLFKQTNHDVLVNILGPITPVGGLLMITAWILFSLKLIKIIQKP